MIAYKANTLRWTNEDGYQRTNNIVIGYLSKNPQKDTQWTIAYQIEGNAVKSFMVDKETVEQIKVRKVTDEMKKAYWFEELEE